VAKYITLENGKMVLKLLEDLPIDSLTEFEAFTSDSEESTTSDLFIVKSGFPYTTVAKTAGDFIIDFTAQVGQSNANKSVSYKVEWREGTSGTWLELALSDNKFPQADGWDYVTSFRKITLSADGIFQVQITWGNTIDGGTGRIRYAGIKLGKVAE